MSRILVITDNATQLGEFNRLLQEKYHVYKNSIDFSTSSKSNSSYFSEILGRKVMQLDLKKPENIDFILRNYGLVFSLHCKQLFPETLVNSLRCINIHPGYNPINRGWFPQVFSIIKHLLIGVTIHEIDTKIDHGPIIYRKQIETHQWETSFDLYKRLLQEEIKLLEEHLEDLIEEKYSTVLPEDEGNFFSKDDFEELLELDLSQKATYGEVINHLRAGTFQGYKNLYFTDTKTGKKIFVSIKLELEE